MNYGKITERFCSAGKMERVLAIRAGRWERTGLAMAFRAGIVLQMPTLAAWTLLNTVKPVGPLRADSSAIWILAKEGLVEDSLASISDAPWAALYDFPRLCLKLLTERMLPSSLDDNVYASNDPAIEKAKGRLREQWYRILRAIPRTRRPAAVITCNFGYLFEREFAGACEQEKIPFIAVHKECFKAPGRLRFFAKTYPRRGPFTGRRILVYNDYERDLIVTAGIAPRAAVTITGMPRLDRVHAWRRAVGPTFSSGRPPTILAFAFTPASALPRLPRKARTGIADSLETLAPEFSGFSWENLFKQYHEAVVRIARDNPGIRVVLKTKGRERDGRPAIEYVESLGMSSNLITVVGGDPFPLLTESDVVLGFNTTALCEAVAAGLPVVVPDFAEATAESTVEYVANLGDAVFHAGSPLELSHLAVRLASDPSARWPVLDAAREAALQQWVGNADGQAGLRVGAAIRAEI